MRRTLIIATLLISVLLAAVSGFAQSQKAIDDELIKEYLAKHNITASKTSSGMYYVITKPGTAEKVKFGKKIHINYQGRFLNDEKFDGNVDDNFNMISPFAFTLGTGQVIRGWDEGVKLLTVGSRATFFVPSAMGYGTKGTGPIPANSVLIFDIEVVSMDK